MPFLFNFIAILTIAISRLLVHPNFMVVISTYQRVVLNVVFCHFMELAQTLHKFFILWFVYRSITTSLHFRIVNILWTKQIGEGCFPMVVMKFEILWFTNLLTKRRTPFQLDQILMKQSSNLFICQFNHKKIIKITLWLTEFISM